MDTDVLFFCFAFVLVRVAFPLPAGLFPEQLPGLTLFIIVVYTYIVNNFLSRHGPVAGLWFFTFEGSVAAGNFRLRFPCVCRKKEWYLGRSFAFIYPR